MHPINIRILALVVGLSTLTLSCDEGFDELNTNDIGINTLDPANVLNRAVIEASPGSFGRSTLVYELAIVQQMITPFGVSVAGGNYNQDNRGVTGDLWDNYYQEVIKNTVDVLDKTRGVPERANLYNMARIWRAFAGMVLTDTYGDVPFTEAGQAFLEGTVNPSYDQQENIYLFILQELEEAAAALNPDQPTENNDVLYNGDITQWRRLGYSLLLRAAMRLSKVAPDLARTYAATAAAGGTMESNADNAYVNHSPNFRNSIGQQLNGAESATFYLTRYFVDYLRTNDDPRLASIAIRYPGAGSGAEQTPEVATTDPAEQVGMPVGYDNTSILPVAEADGVTSFFAYSQVDRNRLTKQTTPQFLVTYAQTQLLLAEAAFRGWIAGDAATYFANGVRAHLEQMALYDAAAAIEESAIETYLQAHSLEAGQELEQINTQYWVASFLNGPEAFANFRRSGYPELPPNPYPGSGLNGDFIRRLTYPNSEFLVNISNINEAIDRQGPDNLETRVWWDQE